MMTRRGLGWQPFSFAYAIALRDLRPTSTAADIDVIRYYDSSTSSSRPIYNYIINGNVQFNWPKLFQAFFVEVTSIFYYDMSVFIQSFHM